MSDSYNNWVDRVTGGRDSKPLDAGEIVKSSAGQPFGAIEFVRIEKPEFTAEVGKKGDWYIYHFYPSSEAVVWKFKKPLEEAFSEVFKNTDEIETAWDEEFQSFAVRVSGYTKNVWGDELALKAIELLAKKLAE